MSKKIAESGVYVLGGPYKGRRLQPGDLLWLTLGRASAPVIEEYYRPSNEPLRALVRLVRQPKGRSAAQARRGQVEVRLEGLGGPMIAPLTRLEFAQPGEGFLPVWEGEVKYLTVSTGGNEEENA